MYQTNIQNQLFSAALPLKPLTAWAGSACSVTVAVPPAPALAGLGVSSVGVTLTLPDGHTVAAAAVQVPGTPLWVATFAPDEFTTAGHVAQGLMFTVAGTDEHDVVRTWIVAKGDVDVVDGDAAPVSGGSYYAVKLRDEAPDDPVEGDAYVADGELSIYHDGEWVTIGGGVVVDEEISADSPNPVRNSAIAAALADKQAALSPSQLDAVNSGVTSAKVATWNGYAAQISQKANTSDVNAALAQKASLADLHYRLVEPGKWEFSGSGVQEGHTYTVELGAYYDYTAILKDNGVQVSEVHQDEEFGLTIDFSSGTPSVAITATRASLPGHLCDRAGNRVVVSGATPLTLPAANPGHMRDLYVRLTVSATSSVTWTVARGETWDAMGAPPASFAASATPYLYRITEVAPGVWHCDDMLALVGLEAALAAVNGGVAS